MRRGRNRQNVEPEFGSDSFLDIIANIVGILIILIVVVGMRIKQTTTTAMIQKLQADQRQQQDLDEQRYEAARQEAEAAARDYQKQRTARLQQIERLQRDWETTTAAIEQANEQVELQQAADRVTAQRRRQVYEQAYAERQAWNQKIQEQQQQADTELQRRLQELAEQKQQQAKIDEEAVALRQQLASMEQQIAEVAQSHRAAQKLADHTQSQLGTDIDQIQMQNQQLAASEERQKKWDEQISANLADKQQQIDKLTEEIRSLESQEAPAGKRWIHYATPVAKQAKLEELHFRCLHRKVSYTYFSELLNDLERKVQLSTLETILSSTRRVGPRGGFFLQYELSAGMNGPLALQARSSLAVLRVNRVELVPESLLVNNGPVEETYSQALGVGSQFQRILQEKPANRFHVTLWVYPDSFELAKGLQIHLHALGFRVAMRPLKFDIPIAASPNGSNSFVQ